MAKVCLVLVLMLGLTAARVMDTSWMQGRRLDRDQVRTSTNNVDSIDIDQSRRISTNDQQRQQFILRLLERVQVPLVDRDICQLGVDFELDGSRYRHGIDDDMMHVLDIQRDNQGNSRRNVDFSLTDREHLHQMVGLYRLLVRSIGWDTFTRNVCSARVHLNGVLFVNALLPALRDREDTRMLVVPAIHDILPEMFLDSHVLERARNLDINMLTQGTNVDSTKSNVLDMIGLGNRRNVMGILRNRDDNSRVTGKNDFMSRTQLWMPWREMHMEMALERSRGRNDIVTSDLDDRIVLPVNDVGSQQRDIRLVTEDVGLKGFLQYLLNDLCIRETELVGQRGGNRNMVDDHLIRVTGINNRNMNDVRNIDDRLMGGIGQHNRNIDDINRWQSNMNIDDVPYVGRGGNLYSKSNQNDHVMRSHIHDGRRVNDDGLRNSMNSIRGDRRMIYDRNDDMIYNRNQMLNGNLNNRRYDDLIGDIRDLPTTTINDDRLLHKNHKKLISVLDSDRQIVDNTRQLNLRDRFMNVLHGNRMDNIRNRIDRDDDLVHSRLSDRTDSILNRWDRDDLQGVGRDDLMHRRLNERNGNWHLGNDDMIRRRIVNGRHILDNDGDDVVNNINRNRVNRLRDDDINRLERDDLIQRQIHERTDNIRNRWNQHDRDDLMQRGLHERNDNRHLGDDDLIHRRIVDGRRIDLGVDDHLDRINRLNIDRDDVIHRRIQDDLRMGIHGDLRDRSNIGLGERDRLTLDQDVRNLPTTSIHDERLLHVNRKKLLNLNNQDSRVINMGDVRGNWNLNNDRTSRRLSIFDRNTDNLSSGEQVGRGIGDRGYLGIRRGIDEGVMGLMNQHRINDDMIRSHRLGGISNGRGLVNDDDWHINSNIRQRDDIGVLDGVRTTSVNSDRLLHVNRRHMNLNRMDINDDNVLHRRPRDTRLHELGIDSDIRVSSEVLLHNLKQLIARLHMERLSLGLTNDLLTDINLVGGNGQRISELGNLDQITGDINGLVGSLLRNIVTDRRVDNQIDIDRQIADQLLGKGGNMNILNLLREVLVRSNINRGGDLTMRDVSGILNDDGVHNIMRRLLNLIDLHRTNILGQYQRDDLALDGVVINDINIDQLKTYIDGKDIDLTNLVDTHNTHKMIVARQNRLNHRDFTIKLRVNSDRNQRVVIRTLLGPKLRERMSQELNIDDRRLDFMLLDTNVVNLNAGENLIVRHSRDILWTRSDVTPLTKIYEYLMTGRGLSSHNIGNIVGQDNRFPHNLLLPRGRENGLPMEVLTIITPINNEHIRDDLRSGLGIGVSRIDGRSLGFPFDRQIQNSRDLLTLRNIGVKDVLIYHDENVRRDLH